MSKKRFGVADYTEERLKIWVSRYKKGLRAVKIETVSALTQAIQGMDILDLGCGSGVFSNVCSERGAMVVSLDFSKLMLEYTRRVDRKPALIQASGENLPFKDGIYDMVLALDVVEHLYKPLQFLREIWRVLKDNGKLLLITPNLTYFETWAKTWPPSRLLSKYKWLQERKKSASLPRRRLYDTHVRVYLTNELVSLLQKTRFTISTYDTFSEIPFFRFLNLLVSLFLRGRLKKYKWDRIFFLCQKTSQS